MPGSIHPTIPSQSITGESFNNCNATLCKSSSLSLSCQVYLVTCRGGPVPVDHYSAAADGVPWEIVRHRGCDAWCSLWSVLGTRGAGLIREISWAVRQSHEFAPELGGSFRSVPGWGKRAGAWYTYPDQLLHKACPCGRVCDGRQGEVFPRRQFWRKAEPGNSGGLSSASPKKSCWRCLTVSARHHAGQSHSVEGVFFQLGSQIIPPSLVVVKRFLKTDHGIWVVLFIHSKSLGLQRVHNLAHILKTSLSPRLLFLCSFTFGCMFPSWSWCANFLTLACEFLVRVLQILIIPMDRVGIFLCAVPVCLDRKHTVHALVV